MAERWRERWLDLKWAVLDWFGYQWFRLQHRHDHRPPAEIVAECTAKVREILKDDPADRFVHSAYEACDKLDEAFKTGKRDERGNG